MLMFHFDRVAVAVHDAIPPTDDEWDRWLARFRERHGLEMRVLVESNDGAGPNAKQRKALAAFTHQVDIRAAVLTDSVLVRGIITAIAWLGIRQRGFPMGHYAQAGEFLGLTSDELAQAMEQIAKLRVQLSYSRVASASR
jgi:hypothetical protein